MCRLMSAAVRASTSSRSSEALTSSPISASVARTSAEVSGLPFAVTATVSVSVGFIEQTIIAGSVDEQGVRRRLLSGMSEIYLRNGAPNEIIRARQDLRH